MERGAAAAGALQAELLLVLNRAHRGGGAEVYASAVAPAWVRGRPGVTSTLIGARRMDQFEANLIQGALVY
jgi:aryl-alcohol dehydrogenase-like predicted oxidoreductase